MSRTKRSAWNIVSGLLLTALTLGSGFVSTPFILRWIGQERFGAYRVLMDWFGYLTLLDLGVIGAVMARLGPKVGTGDERGVFAILSAGLRVYIWISGAMALGGAVIISGMPYFLSDLASITPAELRIAGWVLLIPVVWVPVSVFRALIETRQKAYVINTVLTAQALLNTALLVMAAWAGWGLVGQTLGTTLALLPMPIVLIAQGIRDYKGILRAQPDPAAMAELRSLNWPTFWFNLSGRLGLLSDNIVIGRVLGPTAVSPFFLTQRLAQIAQSQLQQIGNATWAGLVELYAQGQTERFCSRLRDLTSLVSGLGVAILGTIAAYNHHFIHLWLGEKGYAGDWVTLIACFNIWMWAITSLWGWPISGAGHIAKWVPYAMAFTAINVGVSIGATFWVGLPGPLIGTCVGFVSIFSWAMPKVLGQCFAPELAEIWKTAAAPLGWGVPYSLAVWWVAHSHAPWGWIGLAAEAGAAGIAGLLLWWRLTLSPSLRLEWQGRFRAALPA